MNMHRTPWRWCLLITLLALPLLNGCNYFAAAAALTPVYKDPEYKKLDHQSIGVMVWADRGIVIDWPDIQLDVAGAVQSKLEAAQKAGRKELAGATFPVLPASIARYQRDHPEIEAYPITDVAPKLGVSRLIYIEIQDFRTRSEAAVELFHGSLSANVKILEIADGKATAGYDVDGLRVVYPKNSPEEGAMEGQDVQIYAGTLDAFSSELCLKLLRHQVDVGEE
jgi:hypothetical protein